MIDSTEKHTPNIHSRAEPTAQRVEEEVVVVVVVEVDERRQKRKKKYANTQQNTQFVYYEQLGRLDVRARLLFRAQPFTIN